MAYNRISFRDNDRDSFVECPDADNGVARAVKLHNGPLPINVSIDGSGAEFDLADGSVSAIKAIHKTINGISQGDKDTSYATATIIGISITGNTNGNQVKYQIDGKLEDSFFNFPLNDPLYLGTNGEITNTVPVTGHRTRLGTSLGVGAMQIDIEEPIIL